MSRPLSLVLLVALVLTPLGCKSGEATGLGFRNCSDDCFGRVRGEECSGIGGTSTPSPATSSSGSASR